MKKKVYRILFTVVSAIFLISSACLVKILYDYKKAEEEYARIAGQSVKVLPGSSFGEDGGGLEMDSAGDGAAEEEDYFLSVDFEGLKSQNEDITGWIDIPGTTITYPVVQAADNDYYLNRGINRLRSGSGAIFMDCRNSAGLSDDNTIIYGHNMRNGSMFGSLRKYKESEYRDSHPYVDYYMPGQRIRYVIYACYEEDAVEERFPVSFPSEEDQSAYVQSALRRSWVSTEIQPEPGSHTMMLSTCTGNGYTKRWVIQAVEYQRTPMD